MRQIVCFSLTTLVLSSLLITPVFAETNVNVESNTGNNTICVNGKCTTTTNEGKSTVCINGNCQTAAGSITVHAKDGNATVNVTTNVTAGSQGATITPDQNFEKKLQDKKASMEAKRKIQQQKFDLHTFWLSLRRLITLQFLFGKQ